MTDKTEGVSAHERPVMRLDDGLPADAVRFSAGEDCSLKNPAFFDAFGEPRTRYVRVSLHGNHCIMHPNEGDTYMQDARDGLDPEWRSYVISDVYLSEREFEDLPEHDGF